MGLSGGYWTQEIKRMADALEMLKSIQHVQELGECPLHTGIRKIERAQPRQIVRDFCSGSA